jgi:hypothetical protein
MFSLSFLQYIPGQVQALTIFLIFIITITYRKTIVQILPKNKSIDYDELFNKVSDNYKNSFEQTISTIKESFAEERKQKDILINNLTLRVNLLEEKVMSQQEELKSQSKIIADQANQILELKDRLAKETSNYKKINDQSIENNKAMKKMIATKKSAKK